MPFQVCPNTAEVVFHADLNGQIVANIWHVNVPTPPSLEQLQTIRDVFNDWIEGPMMGGSSNQLTPIDLIVTDLTQEGGLQVVKDMTGEGGGEVNSPVKTNQDTLCLTLRSSQRGRSFRGRNYIMAVPTQFYLDSNHITTGQVAAYVADWNGLVTDLATAGFPLGILSRVSGGAPRAQGLITEAVGYTAFDNVIDSQNKRLPGRGR